MSNKRRKQYGWARTKKIPHERHPAHYRYSRKNNNDIEYITFTHSPIVKFDNDNGKKTIVETIPLYSNISHKERINEPNKLSYAMPYLYEGKRDNLYDETDEFNFTKKDKSFISFLFDYLSLFSRKKVSYHKETNYYDFFKNKTNKNK